jgi:hypothetical protein
MIQEQTDYLAATLTRRPEILSSGVQSDLVMFSAQNGRYYGTGPVGHRVWELLSESRKGGDLVEILTREFEVERPVCEREMVAFLKRLHSEGLVEVV